jgi:hypothetical protein
MKLEISHVDIGRLRSEEAYGFLSLAGVEFEKIDNPLFKPVRDEFATRLHALDAVLERAGVSHLTRALVEADARRDAAYRGLAERVRAALRHFNPVVAAAARQLDATLSRYANPAALPYIQENGVLMNLVQDLDTPAARDLLALAGAVDWLDELKASNAEFMALFSTRNEEKSIVVTGAVREARLVAARAYQDCVTRVNALAEIEGPDAYATVIATVNQLIEYQKNVLRQRDARGGKTGERETGTGTGNDEQDPGV